MPGHIWVGPARWAVRIRRATLTVSRPDEAVAFYRDALNLPIAMHDGRATVEIGRSTLVLEQGDDFDGVHHLAFGIAPADFELARTWLNQRVEPILVDGLDVTEGPEGWNSKSVYFLARRTSSWNSSPGTRTPTCRPHWDRALVCSRSAR